jgi:sigma-B regulation protein RsbU (phosphoserine phosphatase)
MIFGLLYPDGSFSYSNAGHSPAIACVNGITHELAAHRPPIGVGFSVGASELAEHQSTMGFGPTDRILLCSDGVSEAFDARREMLGSPRICELLSSMHPDAKSVCLALRDEVHAHCGGPSRTDDVTILCAIRTSALTTRSGDAIGTQPLVAPVKTPTGSNR